MMMIKLISPEINDETAYKVMENLDEWCVTCSPIDFFLEDKDSLPKCAEAIIDGRDEQVTIFWKFKSCILVEIIDPAILRNYDTDERINYKPNEYRQCFWFYILCDIKKMRKVDSVILLNAMRQKAKILTKQNKTLDYEEPYRVGKRTILSGDYRYLCINFSGWSITEDEMINNRQKLFAWINTELLKYS